MTELLNQLGDIMWDFEKLVDDIEDDKINIAERRAKEIKNQLYDFRRELEKEGDAM
ncbi:hypothetical protein [Ruoffia tabacinasalis]|uniref:hypothetical protein n=1 Tax=Ruoffia tabacinasalis TaxID=87458 RepID=UPI0014874541|nr:hypothetical protein [Ruoffia tabacinasalis]